ncbi:MAG: hypothetical protein ACKVOP_11115 [Sphingomonadaceae bacterium]
MNSYNPLSSAQRLAASGLPREHAEAIAAEIEGGVTELVTKEMLDAALDKQTIKISVIMAGLLTLMCTILGTLIALLASVS